MNYTLVLSYAPKIPHVLDGTVRHTIQPLLPYPKRPNDAIRFFHGFVVPNQLIHDGLTPYFEIESVIPCTIYPEGFKIWWNFYNWDSPEGDILARLDGINPPTGRAMGLLFNNMYNNHIVDGKNMQIIRWGSRHG